MKIKISFIALLFMFIAIPKATSQGNPWTQVYFNFNSGWNIHCFAAQDTLVFAGSVNAVLRSTDNGKSWVVPDSGDGPSDVSAITIHGSTVIAATSKGIFRSVDNGQNWNKVSNTLTNVKALSVSGPNIVAGSIGVYISSDDGLTWQPSASGLINIQVNALASTDSFLFAATEVGVFRSMDNGKSWTSISGQLTGLSLVALVTTSKSIFAASEESQAPYWRTFRSTDDGANWTVVDSSYDCLAINGVDLFAGHLSSGGFAFSSDNGTNWVTAPGSWDRLSTLIVSGPNIISGTVNTGIFYCPISKMLNSSDVSHPPTIDGNIILSPNPTTGIITVHTPANILYVTVSSILGESVLELGHPNAMEFTLDLSKLPTGTYCARFEMQGEVIMRKIIKE